MAITREHFIEDPLDAAAEPMLYCELALYAALTLLQIWIVSRVPLSQAYPLVFFRLPQGTCVIDERRSLDIDARSCAWASRGADFSTRSQILSVAGRHVIATWITLFMASVTVTAGLLWKPN